VKTSAQVVFFCALVSLSLAPRTAAQLINLDFSNDLDGSLSATEQAIFQSAADAWNTIIVGYEDGITQTSLTISTDDELSTDGVGGTAASAGPTGAFYQAGYWVANGGVMTFDAADVDELASIGMDSENALFLLAFHEIAHVLGFGTLWELNGLYDQANAPGEYTGSFGLDAYRTEFDPDATFIPVELDGGSGTAHGHWDENYDPVSGFLGLTGITDAFGRDLAFDIMTGWLGPGEYSELYLSETSAYAMQDLGFRIEFIAVPEASLTVLLQAALVTLLIRRKRRN
jgi:hypothetical protein